MLSNITRSQLLTYCAAFLVVTPVQATQITVGDLVRFAQIGDPLALDWAGGSPERASWEGGPGIYSPDGSHVAVLVRGGDPAQQVNTARLLVYSTAELMNDAKPLEVAHLAAANTYQPIAFVRWLGDGETLVFAGTEGEQVSQVYRVNIHTRELERLTETDRQMLWYDIAPSGDRLILLAENAQRKPTDDPECRRFGCRVEATNLYEAEEGRHPRVVSGLVYDVRQRQRRALIDPESTDDRIDFCDAEFTGGMSPDGRHAIRLCRVHEANLPAEWGEYTMNPWYPEMMQTRNVRLWRVGFIIDLETGEPKRWTDAPSVIAPLTAPPIWIDGGKSVILPATFETLTDVDEEERAARSAAYAAQLIDPLTGSATRIGRLDPKVARVDSAAWDEKSQTLMVQGQDAESNPLPPTYFRRDGTSWSAISPPPPTVEEADPAVRLAVEQSLNDRPILFAIDANNKKRQLLDPNPWLADRKLGKVEAIEWRATDGRIWTGGLYYPPDYLPGHRYPLVIQTHGFDTESFSLDGAARNFPGQALTTLNMMVLQVDENQGSIYTSPDLWSDARAGYEGAIDHLDALGLIDRTRVGTIGWSATGPTTAALLTHSDYPIAAAGFTDTAVFGLWYYIRIGASESQHARFGAQPFGEGMGRWLELSPTHNLHRMRTPLLMWGGGGVSGLWDWYSGLEQLNKPVELWNLPAGTHDVYQASQRLKTNQRLVDWFRFWLEDEERTELVPWGGETAASLREQYVRWRGLRKQQDAVLAQPRPPLLEWTPTPIRGNSQHLHGR